MCTTTYTFFRRANLRGKYLSSKLTSGLSLPLLCRGRRGVAVTVPIYKFALGQREDLGEMGEMLLEGSLPYESMYTTMYN